LYGGSRSIAKASGWERHSLSAANAKGLGVKVGGRGQVSAGTTQIGQLSQRLLELRLRSVLAKELNRTSEMLRGRRIVTPLLRDARRGLSRASQCVEVVRLTCELNRARDQLVSQVEVVARQRDLALAIHDVGQHPRVVHALERCDGGRQELVRLVEIPNLQVRE